MRLKLWLWLTVGAFLAIAAWNRRPDAPPEQLLARARAAAAAGDNTAAEAICRRTLLQRPDSAESWLILGQIAASQRRWSAALLSFSRIPEDASREALEGHRAAGEIHYQLGHAAAAEAQVRAVLSFEPHDTAAHRRLAYLLTIEGRRWESRPHLFELLRQNRFSIEMLLLLGDLSSTVATVKELQQFRRGDQADALPLLGLARIALNKNEAQQAQSLLTEVLTLAPEQIEAQAELGQILLDSADEKALEDWMARLPEAADSHPDIWRIRGQWAKRRGQPRAAARCFWEALRLDPSQQASTYQLVGILEELGEITIAEQLSRRAAELQELALTLRGIYNQRRDLGLIRKAARLTESLGRVWEAWGWHCWARSIDDGLGWAVQGAQRLQEQLADDLPLTLFSQDPSRQIDLSGFPLPRRSRAMASDNAMVAAPLASPRFEDVAAGVGIDFAYFNGSDRVEEGARMFQFTGGGVAVLDYDADGWPDLYFTQGCRWTSGAEEPKATQTEHLDRLFRNLGDGRFQDVTGRSGLMEDRFSQGAAVGDLNNDGFPDLYVANVGLNRLYVNQGDGTFRDATETARIDYASWTISCLLADMNGDGSPDLYDANYVQGSEVYKRVCREMGQDRVCMPGLFEPQLDRFHLSLSNGQFQNATQIAGLASPGGNGMGLLAADFNGSGQLSLFVANDQDANFYFANQTSRRGDPPRFAERAIVSGLAFDGEGRVQACMGVAAGDANGDGKLDLFTTNFYGEPNTLYLQDASELFSDATAQFGLREPSLPMLGFGAQFVDGELDGWPDIVVANGHIGDFTFRGAPYRMRPQYFRNLSGKFEQLPSGELGAYFQGEYLGRGLARIDWNRDGREDFVVSHLGDSAALLTNKTEHAGHFLALQLRGIQSSRDAIGAIVTLTAAGRQRRQWLTAGDGYEASNQRQLIFGLGRESGIEKLHVLWPSGLEQEFENIPVDQELTLLEGSPKLVSPPSR